MSVDDWVVLALRLLFLAFCVFMYVRTFRA